MRYDYGIDCVISGMGIVSPIGNDCATVRNSLKNGCGGISRSHFTLNEKVISCNAGRVKNIPIENYIEKKKLRYIPCSVQYAIVAAHEALNDAELNDHGVGEGISDIAVVLGSAFCSLEDPCFFYRDALKDGYRYVNPSLFPNIMPSTSASLLSIYLSLKGGIQTMVAGNVSGLDAIDAAIQMIQSQNNHIVLAGGVDALSTELIACLMNSNPAMDCSGSDIQAPYSRERKGFYPAEGAVFFVMESAAHALKRGAKPRAHLSRISRSVPGTTGDRMSSAACMREVMRSALTSKDGGNKNVNYILSAANGSVKEDALEAQAIHQLATHGISPPVTAIKSYTGEMFGAGACMQMAGALLDMEQSVLTPVHGLATVAPDLPPLPLVTSRVEADIETVLVHATDIQNGSSAITLKRYREK